MSDKKKILVVEDEVDLVDALKIRLEANGYDVIVAYDGQEGLNMARTDSPDLIIQDVMLPKLDGFHACRMLKFDKKFDHIPIIMLTARSQEQDQKIGYETGADAYITKPFDSQHLLATIEKLIGNVKKL